MNRDPATRSSSRNCSGGTCLGEKVTCMEAPPHSRGLHSSSFRLNVSAFCGIRSAFRGCLGGVYEVSESIWGG